MNYGWLPLETIKSKSDTHLPFFFVRHRQHISLHADNNTSCSNKDLNTEPPPPKPLFACDHQISTGVRTRWPSRLGDGAFFCRDLTSGLNSTSPSSRVPMFPDTSDCALMNSLNTNQAAYKSRGWGRAWHRQGLYKYAEEFPPTVPQPSSNSLWFGTQHNWNWGCCPQYLLVCFVPCVAVQFHPVNTHLSHYGVVTILFWARVLRIPCDCFILTAFKSLQFSVCIFHRWDPVYINLSAPLARGYIL